MKNKGEREDEREGGRAGNKKVKMLIKFKTVCSNF